MPLGSMSGWSMRIHRPSRSLSIQTTSTVADRHHSVDIMVDIYFTYFYSPYMSIHPSSHKQSSLAGKRDFMYHNHHHMHHEAKNVRSLGKSLKSAKNFADWPHVFHQDNSCTRNSSVKHAVAFNHARQLTGTHKQTHALANE